MSGALTMEGRGALDVVDPLPKSRKKNANLQASAELLKKTSKHQTFQTSTSSESPIKSINIQLLQKRCVLPLS